MHAVAYSQPFAAFSEDVVASVIKVCGQDAQNWSTCKAAFAQIQTTRVWEDWVSSGLTREQLVQFVHRLRIKKLKGDGAELLSQPLERAPPGFSFRIPKGWRILPAHPEDRSRKTYYRVAHRFSDGWAIGTVVRPGKERGYWVRYSAHGRREDWLHDCRASDYGKCWFMLERKGSKPAVQRADHLYRAGRTRRGTSFAHGGRRPSQQGRPKILRTGARDSSRRGADGDGDGDGDLREELSDYEKRRKDNMDRNRAILVSLGLAQ